MVPELIIITPQGRQGETGHKGDLGPPGFIGSDGFPGLSGPLGPSGTTVRHSCPNNYLQGEFPTLESINKFMTFNCALVHVQRVLSASACRGCCIRERLVY